MKKWKIPVLLLLLLVVIISMWFLNRQIAPRPSVVSPEPGDAQQTIPSLNAASPTEPPSTAGETAPADAARIIKNYPEYQITIDAPCPSVTEARVLPCLSARISETYFHNMVQDFLLARYPDAKRTYVNEGACSEEWTAYGPESEYLAHISQAKATMGQDRDFEEGGRVYFDCRKKQRNFNGTYISDYWIYNYFVDETALDDGFGAFMPSAAIEEATQILKAYTDFDLTVHNVGAYFDKAANDYGYEMRIVPSYMGTPVSIHGKAVNGKKLAGPGIDIDINRETGIEYIQGVFHFEQIEEKELCQVISLEDAIAAFEKEAPFLMLGVPNPSLEIYCIQLEYFPQLENDEGEYSFRPVWTFYGMDANNSSKEFMFCADTGELCYSFQMYVN